MKNFKITCKENGKSYWISRSIAIHGMIVAVDSETGEEYILLEKRGPGCPDEVGKWANPTGYLDWDETLMEGLEREVYEELGLKLSDLKTKTISFNGIDDSISGENKVKQNVTIRYIVYCDYEEIKDLLRKGVINTDTLSRGGEQDEVSAITLLKLDRKYDEGLFAFNQGEVITNYYNSRK